MLEILRSGEVLRDQTHRELVYRPFQFRKGRQLFIGTHDETLSVAVMRVGRDSCGVAFHLTNGGKIHPALLRLSAMISQYFTRRILPLLLSTRQ